MIKANTRVNILPAFQDEGDDEFVWVALSDEEKGRVDITPVDHPFDIAPVYTVRAEWVEAA